MTLTRRSHEGTCPSPLGPPSVAPERAARPRSSGASGPDRGRTARASGSAEALPRLGTAAGRSDPAELSFGTPFGEETTEDDAVASPEDESRSLPRPEGVRRIAGGVVAFNDEGRVERSIRSLLAQELPRGYAWSRIWLVASGCTDRTAEVGRAIARQDPRLEVVVEPTRRGKAAAIREVLRRAEGESLVLLNSDAFALPGAVSALLRAAEGRPAPYAVMGRPVVPEDVDGIWADSMRWMWELHHVLHLELLAEGRGAHLSDELLLLSLPTPVPLGAGIINDGSFLGVWLCRNEGGCWYAPAGLVSIDVPRTASDFLRQRRRIHVGNAQVRRLLGHPPTTILRFLLDEPARAFRALRSALDQRGGAGHLLRVGFWEVVSRGLAGWDLLPPARDHVHWVRIRSPPTRDASRTDAHFDSPGAAGEDVERQVGSFLGVAAEFGTGIALDHLAELLSPVAPISSADLERYLSLRPNLARLEHGRAYRPRSENVSPVTRAARGAAYGEWAARWVSGPLAFTQRWVRCVGITGSAAYGEPESGDDLDLFVVTRTGSLWWFLLTTFLTLRLRRLAGKGRDEPEPCVNYVLDDSRALEEFSGSRGYLFAREALMLRPIAGASYYEGLLARSGWMEEVIPRLYARRTRSPGECRPSRAPRIVRLLNAITFLPLAAYLHLAGLRRNARARRAGNERATFRTVTRLHRFALSTLRFEELRHRYPRAGPERAARTAVPSPTEAFGSR